MNAIKLLLVEDDLTDQLGFKRFVKKQKLPYQYDISGSVKQAVNRLAENKYDIIIADHSLGDGTAFDLFEFIPATTPIIFVTGNGNEHLAVKALKAGASDYLTKDIEGNYLQLLPLTIENVLKVKADEVELDNYRQGLEKIVKQRTKELEIEIKQRKIVEQQLRLLAVAFDTHEAVVITDVHANILRVNQAFVNLTEYSMQEVVGKNMNILNSGLQNTEFYSNLWKELLETGQYDGEMWNRRKSGETFPERLTITAIVNDVGITTHYVGNLADISMQKTAEEEIKKLAFYDPLTGLANRRLLLDRIKHECAIAKRNKHFGSVIFIDLDDFKPVNDTYGHNVGDELLIQIAKRLRENLREDDTASRLGGDEFIILIHANDSSYENALTHAKIISSKIQCVFNDVYTLNKQRHVFSASMGIAIFPQHANDAESILNKADKAMYESKKNGGNCISIYQQ